MSNPRKATASIQYNGVNITTKLAEYLKSFTYTDVASGESDSISISLADKDKKWINAWFPSLGDIIIPKILTYNWLKDGDKKTFKCGSFTIDQCDFSGRPLNATIGALSIPATESFKTTERNKTWTNITIEAIAKEIAQRAGISLSYDAPTVLISQIEQSGQTDSDFLYSLCQTYGLAMKVYYNKLVIFDEASYENKKSVATIYESDMKTWSYKSSLTRSYTGAEITYLDPDSSDEINVKVGSGSRILRLNEKADGIKDAQLKALAKVNNANKKMFTMKITMMANPKVVASSNIDIKGLGKLDGKYYVDSVTHSVGSTYTMSLYLRRIQKRITLNSKNDSNDDTSQYTIQPGDTLWIISKNKLGSGARYLDIYESNKDIIEEAAITHGKINSNNGSILYPGTIITMPV